MKILALADQESPALWEHYTPGKLKEYDLILACGDLNPKYLSFIVTMARCPVLYIHGNHDAAYDRIPPDGCDCIEDDIVVFKGLRIMGLGGSLRYRPGPHQYTEKEMRKRIRKLRFKLWWHKGVDVVITHAPPKGIGDSDNLVHRGFAAFLALMDKYHPKYLLHGHVHLNYGRDQTRVRSYGDTQVINVFERYVLDIPEEDIPKKSRKGRYDCYV